MVGSESSGGGGEEGFTGRAAIGYDHGYDGEVFYLGLALDPHYVDGWVEGCLERIGEGHPEGQLTDGMLDQLAKYERAKTLERTRRGKLRKAQEGKVVGTGIPPYGFYFADDHYHVNHDRMKWVHIIFEMIADGHSFYDVTRYLRRNGAPSLSGAGGQWYRAMLRYIILNDVYLGTYWWGGENRVAIPVPDSGVPSETVVRARESIKNNVQWISRSAGRTWELSGGVAVCSECGRAMGAHTVRNSEKKSYYYYRCPNREHNGCSHKSLYPAWDLEKMVADAIVEAFQPETWESFVHDLCDRELEDLRRATRLKSRETLAGLILALETKLDRARELFIEGDLTRPSYEEKKSLIQEEIEVVQGELAKSEDLAAEIRRVEDIRYTLLHIENPLSGHYTLTDLPSDKDVVTNEDAFYGDREMAARRRQIFYRERGMKVKVGEELEIILGVDRISVCKGESLSGTIC